jgi:hypothetical protein
MDVTIRWAPLANTTSFHACIWNVINTLQYDVGFKSSYTTGTSIRFTSVTRFITVPAGGASQQWYLTCRAATLDNTTVNVYPQILRIS